MCIAKNCTRLWSESSWNVRSQGTKLSQGQKFQWMKVPRDRKFPLWTIRSREQKCWGTKTPDSQPVTSWQWHCAWPLHHIRLWVDNAATRQQSHHCLLLPHPSSETDSTASRTRRNNHSISTFVLSRLDYCNAVLAGLPKVTISQLQSVQNAAAQITVRVAPHDHMTTALATSSGFLFNTGLPINSVYICDRPSQNQY